MTKKELMNKVDDLNKQVYALYNEARKVKEFSKDQMNSIDHSIDLAFRNLCDVWYECR